MTLREGWLERQLKAASTAVDSWPSAKREALALNRTGYSCSNQANTLVIDTTQRSSNSNNNLTP